MKLLRYGPRARKSPVCSTATARSAISPARFATSTARRCRRPRSTGCAGSTRRPCRWSRARRGSGRASAACRRSSRSGSTIGCTPQEAGTPIPKEPIFFLKAIIVDLRPERRRDHPEGLGEDRLRGRARHRDRHQARAMSQCRTRRSTSPAIASSTTSPSANTRSSAAANGPRARAPTRSARWGRGSSPPTRCRPRQAAGVDRGQRRAAAGQQHLRPDLRDRPHRQLCQPVHDADAGRRDPDRHAVGGRRSASSRRAS